MDGISRRDLNLLRDALDPALRAEPHELIAQAVLEEVARLVPCEDVTLQVMNYPHRTISAQTTSTTWIPDSSPEADEIFWEGFWASTCSYPQRTGDMSITRSSDFPPLSRSDPVDLREYEEAMGPMADEMLVPLPLVDLDDHRLLLAREEGPAFTERDVMVLTLLRPHIAELHARQIRRASGAGELTARQLEILRLVAAGCTNRQISRALDISEGTTRKHLENIYVKLGANSRTGALTSAGLVGNV